MCVCMQYNWCGWVGGGGGMDVGVGGWVGLCVPCPAWYVHANSQSGCEAEVATGVPCGATALL